MGSQKQRQERLMVLAEKWKQNKENGCSEALNCKMIRDYMIQIWYLGYATQQDYLSVLQSLELKDSNHD